MLVGHLHTLYPGNHWDFVSVLEPQTIKHLCPLTIFVFRITTQLAQWLNRLV